MMPSQRASVYVAALRIPVTMLCVFGTVLAAYYFFYVTLHRTYLIERNFRLLATLAEQITASIDDDHGILNSLLVGHADESSRQGWDIRDARIKQRAAGFIPFLRSAEVINWPEPTSTPTQRDAVVLQLVEPESRSLWVRRDEAGAKATRVGVVRLDLAGLLDTLLSGEARKGIFDALLVATADGRVIFQTGDTTLRIAHFDRLTQRADGKTAELSFGGLARSPSMVDVLVSGSPYKLFTQPCCGLMAREAGSATTTGDGWVLCGLIAQRTLSAQSYAVSFSILTLLSVVLLAGLLSWPFLKLTLLGESQRVTAHDVVLVGISTLLAVALITIGALDYFAYGRRLQAALDGQLTRFAIDVDARAKAEIDRASNQLDRLVNATGRLASESEPNLARINDLFEGDTLEAYPFFESFALIGRDGMQKRKLTLGSVGTLFIPVGHREYFAHSMSSARGAEPFIEPIRSATTGARETVLSKPTERPDTPVAALSFSLRALIGPVIVPGFGFAVINQDGKVLFHSDPEHNLSENFFIESDGNRRLRALVRARHQELVDIKYWGDDHRAFVFPMSVGQQWTLVTFYDTDLIRTVNVEWLILTLGLLVLYVGLYVVICLGIMLVRPRYRAPWLWPDPERSKAYVSLLPPLVLLSAAFAVAIAVLPLSGLVVMAWLLPFLAWVVAYHELAQPRRPPHLTWPIPIGLGAVAFLLVLAVRAEDRFPRVVLVALLGSAALWVAAAATKRTKERQSTLAPPVNVAYGLAAGLMVLLTAVLPAAAFFRVGHAMQIGSLIKYGQLQVALDRLESGKQAREADTQQIEALRDDNWWGAAEGKLRTLRASEAPSGLYQNFFFSTEAASSDTCDEKPDAIVSSDELGVVPDVLEELLPFYSELSVRLRELVHDRAADRSWRWRRQGADLVFCMGANAVPPFKSTVPRFLEATLDSAGVTNVVVLVALSALVVGAIVWLVRFVLHKVFVVDVIEPLWSGTRGSLQDVWGPNLFLVSDTPITERLHSSNYCEVDLAHAPDDPSVQSRWFDDQFDRLAQSPAAHNVLMLHFEHRLQDPATTERKLTLLERIIAVLNRTIVIVSAAPPGRFARAGASPGAAAAAHQAGWMRRWADVLSRFTVIPVGAAAAVSHQPSPGTVLAGATAGWREILWRVNALGFAHSARFLDDERRDAVVERLWKDVLPYAWHPERPALDVNQLLIEVGERSENYYREMWESCKPAEKVVLGQIAAEGLVNKKTERTVRVLMASGLVRRQPNFVLLNETFRRFVLSASARAEVSALEGEARSRWDAIRGPFLILLIGSLTFFFATQHELFNAALGILTGLAATLPALVKMASLFGERREAE